MVVWTCMGNLTMAWSKAITGIIVQPVIQPGDSEPVSASFKSDPDPP
jgi:hypothetical protein